MKKTLLWKTLILLCLLLSVALMLHPQAVRVRYFHPTEERLAYYPFTSPLRRSCSPWPSSPSSPSSPGSSSARTPPSAWVSPPSTPPRSCSSSAPGATPNS